MVKIEHIFIKLFPNLSWGTEDVSPSDSDLIRGGGV